MYRLTAFGIAVRVPAAACSSAGDSVAGTVTKIDRKGLPENAVLQVELRDTSLQDVASALISLETIEINGNQLPVSYRLPYDPDEIDERNTYAVSARITSDGQLIYISDMANLAITHGNPTEEVEVTVVPVGG